MKKTQTQARHAARWMFALALAANAAVVLNVGAAGVYKWVDENGDTHYGDKPPAYTAREEVRLRKTPAVDPNVNTRNARTERLLDSFAAERKEKQAERAAVVAEKQARADKCAKARDVRQQYENSAFIYTKNSAGERVILNDEQHARAMDEARGAVEQWCD